jgi:hypothetical protein
MVIEKSKFESNTNAPDVYAALTFENPKAEITLKTTDFRSTITPIYVGSATISLISCNFIDIDGNALIVEAGTVNDDGTNYNGLTKTALSLINGSSYNGANAKFSRISHSDNGATAFVSKATTYTCRKCNYHTNQANQGGIIFLEQKSFVTLEGSTVEDNVAVIGSAFYINDSTLTLISTELRRNWATKQALIQSINAEIDLYDVKITGNTSSEEAIPGFIIKYTTLNVELSQFSEQKGN